MRYATSLHGWYHLTNHFGIISSILLKRSCNPWRKQYVKPMETESPTVPHLKKNNSIYIYNNYIYTFIWISKLFKVKIQAEMFFFKFIDLNMQILPICFCQLCSHIALLPPCPCSCLALLTDMMCFPCPSFPATKTTVGWHVIRIEDVMFDLRVKRLNVEGTKNGGNNR